MQMRDVAIIGGGPAGLAAAERLASAGHDTLVLEEHATVGVPEHCTGVLGVEAFDELDLPRESICSITGSAAFFAASGQRVVVDSDEIRAAVVDRALFDQVLAARAVEAGATVERGRRVTRIDPRPAAVGLTLADGAQVTARACVIACGANYRFNRTLGLGVPRTFQQSAQIEVPFPPREHIEVHLGRDVAPRGFAWLVPFVRDGQTRVRIGLACQNRALVRFRAFVDHVRRINAVNDEPWPAPRLKILPLGPVDRTYGPRILVVGDAAGLVKPTTGGGIYYGLLSGRLAADTLDRALRADDLGEATLKRYEQTWRERLGPEIRIGLAFRTLASRLNDSSIEALVELARVDGLVPLLRRTATFNWHRDAALALLRNASFRKILLGSLWS